MTTQYIYDLVDTWNDGATTFTAIKMNVTDTASNASSLLMDLQRGGSSYFGIGKTGQIINQTNGIDFYTFGSVATASNRRMSIGNTFVAIGTNSIVALNMCNSNTIGWTSDGGTSSDLIISRRAAANLRFGAADAAAPVAQTLSVQSVVAGTTNTAGTNLTITGSQGTGTGAGGSIIFQVATAGSSGSAQNALATALTIGSTGNVTTSAAVVVGGDIYLSGLSNAALRGVSSGIALIANTSFNDFNRLQFGGTTSSFPALKRSSTTLQARLADDSAFAPVQGKLTTDTAYTAGSIVATGYLTLYDSTGTAYRVPCVV